MAVIPESNNIKGEMKETKILKDQQPYRMHAIKTEPEPRVALTETGAIGAIQSVSGLDWDSLKSHTLACRSCCLCETRTQVVFGVGNPKCSLMLIGEAPGEQEDLTGEPFVGKSGQLLDQMLKAIDLDRSVEKGVYIANTLKCRPPGNRNPQPQELSACEPLLRHQIQLIRPKVLLAVGRFAVQWLMGVDEIEGSISSLRNKKHVYKDGDLEIPFVVTYHPSYLLRNPSAKALAWDDLCFLRNLLFSD
jgi:uracil-DNA glycosylase family 4